MRGEPRELEIGRVALSACALLAREMDEVGQELAHRAGTDRLSIHREPARSAERIVTLCCRLQQEMRRYAASRWWLRDESDDATLEDGELGF